MSLGGCAASPSLGPFALTPKAEPVGGEPIRECAWPEIGRLDIEVDGEVRKYATISGAEGKNLLICIEAFDKNVEIAEANRVAAEKMRAAHNAAVAYAATQYKLANFELSEIDQRRKSAELESLWLKLIIAIAATASAF